MRRLAIACLCTGAAVLAFAGCSGSGSGGTETPVVQNFQLTTCDTTGECKDGFSCQPVFCDAKCVPDGAGKCLPCNGGKAGKCLPKPPVGCDAMKCAAGTTCVESCTGSCDAAGKCMEVACEAQCVPAPKTCSASADCGTGKHCEFMCTKGCASPMEAAADAMPKCPGSECFGQCVDDPPAPKACNVDGDCAAGQVCEAVMCPMMCARDGKGGCLPCNGGYNGVCIDKPTTGCKADAECAAGELCVQYCTGVCDAFAPGCQSACFGQCVKQNTCAAIDCGPGYACTEVCSACAAGTSATGTGARAGMRAPSSDAAPVAPPCGECMPQCVPVTKPVQCNADADCGAGRHCEPVYCTMECVPDPTGACAPCNGGFLGNCVDDAPIGCGPANPCPAGQRCETACMGACDPNGGCFEQCTGTCVPAQPGCQANADCAAGFHCEVLCSDACGTARGSGSAGFRRGGPAADPMPPTDCVGSCIGQCVQDPVTGTKCNTSGDCPAGSVCEAVYCAEAAKCVPDEKGGCGVAPYCNDGYFGVCVPKPQGDCATDADCAPGEACQVYCTGACAPGTGCASGCFGSCVPVVDPSCGPDKPCPAGYACQQMCPDCYAASGSTDCLPCAPGAACAAVACVSQCVPVAVETKCNADADCGAGARCELVYCAMSCATPSDGSAPACLPCNDGYLGVCTPDPTGQCAADSDCKAGEACEVYCMGACDPTTGCADLCVGTCVQKQAGCTGDDQCGAGMMCEVMCPPCAAGGSAGPAGASGGSRMPVAPPCVDATCYGQCVPKPTACKADADCAPGEACVAQSVCPACVYATPACAMPCTVETACVAVPAAGCQDDTACPAGQACVVACEKTCDASGCTAGPCQGQCIVP